MSAQRLRAVADAHQREWAAAVDRVASHWSTSIAALEHPDEAFEHLQRMLVRESRNAAAHGAIAVRDSVIAAGAEPADLPRLDVDPPVALARTLATAWRTSTRQPLPRLARGAVLARIIDRSLSDAWRLGTHAALLATDAVVAWRRVARAGCCGACLALADGTARPLSEQLDEHPFGRCFAEAVVLGVNDHDPGRPNGLERWGAMSGAAQNAMFAGHGGAAKADLIRTGQVTLSDLVTWAPRSPGLPRLPRETSLRELLDRATAASAATGLR